MKNQKTRFTQRKTIQLFAVGLWVRLLSFQWCTWWGCTTPILKVQAIGHHRITNQAYINVVEVECASELSGTEKENNASEEIINWHKIPWLISWINKKHTHSSGCWWQWDLLKGSDMHEYSLQHKHNSFLSYVRLKHPSADGSKLDSQYKTSKSTMKFLAESNQM